MRSDGCDPAGLNRRRQAETHCCVAGEVADEDARRGGAGWIRCRTCQGPGECDGPTVRLKVSLDQFEMLDAHWVHRARF